MSAHNLRTPCREESDASSSNISKRKRDDRSVSGSDEETESSEEETSSGDEEVTSEDEDDERVPTVGDAITFVSMFRNNHRGINSNDEAKRAAASFVNETSSGMIAFIVKTLLPESSRRGISVERARPKIVQWINSSNAVRPILFMTKQQMMEYADEMLTKSKQPSKSLRAAQYRDALTTALLDGGSDENSIDESCTVEDFDLLTAVEVLRSGFMKPQKQGKEEGEKAYTLKGQRAERPILEMFYELVKDDEKFDAMYHLGLAATSVNGRPSENNHDTIVRTSADAYVIYTSSDDDVQSACPIEVKNRVSPSTFTRQIEAIKRTCKNKGDTARWSVLGRDQCPWAKLNAYSDDLKSLVQSDSELW